MSFVKSPQYMAEIARRKPEFYGAEMLSVFWETRPEIVERLLPPPLEPADLPLVTAFVANYPRTNFGPPYLEGALLIRAAFDGVEGNYCLAMPVTGDMAMAGGREVYGFPKKMADITLRREGAIARGSLARLGQRFFEVEATLDGQLNTPEFLATFMAKYLPDASGHSTAVTYNFKYFPAPNGAGFDYPPRLVRQITILRPRQTEMGSAQVTLIPSDCDPWHEVEIVRVLGAVCTVGDNTMESGAAIAEVSDQEFAPYATVKWDY